MVGGSNGGQTAGGSAVLSYFASARRIPLEELAALAEEAVRDPIIDVILKSVGGYVLILNETRQILAASREVLDALGLERRESLVGMRPGEAFGCEHAAETPGGCGTARHCRHCGAVIAILASQTMGEPSSDECSLAMVRNGVRSCREFRVRVQPIAWKGGRLLVFVLADISAEKRRQVLEQAFLHDIRNDVGALLGFGEILRDDGDPVAVAERIVRISEILSREIEEQHTLVLAESGELKPHPSSFAPHALFDALRDIFAAHPAVRKRSLVFEPAPASERIETDFGLLTQVLANMIKNALEATPPGGTVRVWFERSGGCPVFFVWNAGVMAAEVSDRVFERSFSTKQQPGRGIGTYVMKLLGERYLGGRVSFTTSLADGTAFSITLPR